MAFSNDAVVYLVNTCGLLEEDKTESPGAARHGVQFQSAVDDVPKLGEVVFQVLLGRVPAEAADKHLPIGNGTITAI